MSNVIESAIKWMEDTAKDDSHGYSQTNRWGPDYDCSSSVITAWQVNGVPVKSKGATYTGNMYNVFLKCGFKDVTSTVNLRTGAGLRRGDVLLNKKHHTAMYCGNKKEVEASINELGKAVGGKTGDQTGREFLIRSYRNYPWDCVLRYEGEEPKVKPIAKPTSGIPGKLYKDDSVKNGKKFKITASSLNLRTDGSTAASNKIVKVLKKGDTVTWYGYYKFDSKKNKWLYVIAGTTVGYICEGESGKKYIAAI